jgi:hypothetical protein
MNPDALDDDDPDEPTELHLNERNFVSTLASLAAGAEKSLTMGAVEEAERVSALQIHLVYQNPKLFLDTYREAPGMVVGGDSQDAIEEMGFRSKERRMELSETVEQYNFPPLELPDEIVERCSETEIDIE